MCSAMCLTITVIEGLHMPTTSCAPVSQAGTAGTPDAASIALLEGQLTWLTHIVGSIIRGRLNQSTVDSQVRKLGVQLR
jgi:hypothetical protein